MAKKSTTVAIVEAEKPLLTQYETKVTNADTSSTKDSLSEQSPPKTTPLPTLSQGTGPDAVTLSILLVTGGFIGKTA